MTYNIHPLLVHFPIAFLLLYSLLRILPFDRWFPKVSWREIRFVVLLAGVLGAFFANTTGEVAEHIARPDHKIVETHAFFALLSTWVYGLLCLGEVLFFTNSFLSKKIPSSAISVLSFVERILTNKAITMFLALSGVVAISITGMLGGVMVYGVSADPLAPFVLKLLGLS